MRREGINLRSTGGDPEGVRPKLLDSKSRRPNNNKITIYSQKYTTLVSSQSLPEDNEHIYSTTSTLKSDSKSLSFNESHPQQLFNSQKLTQSSKQLKKGRQLDVQVMTLIREEIAAAKQKYEVKTRELMETNAKIISELRQGLLEQQQKLTEKEHLIRRLINERMQNGNNPCNSPLKHQNSKRLRLGQFLYLQNRVEDLQVKLKIVLQTLNTGDQETAERIGHIQQKLIQYHGWKMGQFRCYLDQLATVFSQKMDKIQKQLSQEGKPIILQSNMTSIQEEVQQLKKSMISLEKKEWKYQSQPVTELKSILDGLRNSMQGLASSRNRHGQYYFEEDDDEFFYPHTDRVYQSADDYQHFQADSEEEREKKENRHPNERSTSFKFPN